LEGESVRLRTAGEIDSMSGQGGRGKEGGRRSGKRGQANFKIRLVTQPTRAMGWESEKGVHSPNFRQQGRDKCAAMLRCRKCVPFSGRRKRNGG